eukprot:CAMPEP_0175928694 /NCGR_PEP_ID=MMETSP0108-20121206/17382_1 /TAXON_ID=195067 ORGANISM="Goniomonas pacifica, Strain CCMP1869" /NCGR_SAMPLE_ID=MMETSP0108 /ASSEMBLY_ACC=CAM_ASM_000204 /LENGTH=73 /DNA_ID=CAMNT_0017252061 /DNA_START=247 /DNA_END=464 /DNA_ORIENTATION=-
MAVCTVLDDHGYPAPLFPAHTQRLPDRQAIILKSSTAPCVLIRYLDGWLRAIVKVGNYDHVLQRPSGMNSTTT